MRPTLEVADIVRAHGDEFRRAHAASLSPRQKRALRNIELCRTAALGGHLERCDQCDHERNAYNSCAPPLPQVPVPSQSQMAGKTPGRTSAGGIFPCGIYTARTARQPQSAE